MIDYTGKENIFDIEHKELGQISQNCNQFDNCSITIFEVMEDSGDLKAGMLFGKEDMIADSNEYILEDDDIAELKRVGIEKYLEDWADMWANNGEEDQVVEMCRWGLHDIEDYAYEGENTCNVLVEGCYYGYTPIDRAKDERGDVLKFANSKAAQAWIDAQEEGRYYLSHNEAGRPQYVIVEAL